MLHRLLLAGTALASLVLASCGERSAPPKATAGGYGAETTARSPSATAAAGGDGSVTSTPTSTPSPTPSPTPAAPAPRPPPSAAELVRVVAAVEPAGRVVLAREVETVVDPAATFELELGASVPDARLLLVDANDAHVEASAAREVAATTKVSLAPAAPLVPGSRYLLRLDGASTRELHDAAGRAYAPVSFAILVAGTPPPPAEPKKRRRR